MNVLIKTKEIKLVGWINLLIGVIVLVLMAVMVVKIKIKPITYVAVEIMASGSTGWQQGATTPPSWLMDAVKIGDSEKTLSGQMVAEVVDVRSYDEGVNKVTFFKVKLKVDRDSRGLYRYKQKSLEVGGTIDLSLGSTKIYGSVVAIGEENIKAGELEKVTIKLFGRRHYFSDEIKVGDKMMDEYNQQTQVEIVSKKVTASPLTVTRSDGQLVVQNDPVFDDVELQVWLRVVKRNGINYFANYQPVKIGNKLYVPMADYNLYEAEVVKVETAAGK